VTGVAHRVSHIARATRKRRLADRESDDVLGLLQAIEATAPVGLGFVDLDFRIVRINDTLAALNGGTVEQQLHRTVGAPG
jgi:two-component system, NtrC family, sensor kinase